MKRLERIWIRRSTGSRGSTVMKGWELPADTETAVTSPFLVQSADSTHNFFKQNCLPVTAKECHHERPVANWIRKSVTVQDNLEDDRDTYFIPSSSLQISSEPLLSCILGKEKHQQLLNASYQSAFSLQSGSYSSHTHVLAVTWGNAWIKACKSIWYLYCKGLSWKILHCAVCYTETWTAHTSTDYSSISMVHLY
ncbi:hypothetical protein AV530_019559 [Patagioenas fasciata monilis]|uniref:Uncharacterized protein n=1 Tax=Patagioenas fasciata monilis TaxID=372326 RepID=A0A1V4JE11_PATFA|nr:hypothetical protein AV530_019559 [Patagioenas fasciata monilis]